MGKRSLCPLGRRMSPSRKMTHLLNIRVFLGAHADVSFSDDERPVNHKMGYMQRTMRLVDKPGSSTVTDRSG